MTLLSVAIASPTACSYRLALAIAMAHLKGPANAGNLKIGDVVLLYYNADNLLPGSAEKSGFILADLSGYVAE